MFCDKTCSILSTERKLTDYLKASNSKSAIRRNKIKMLYQQEGKFMEKMNNENLENVAGGSAESEYVHDLSKYVYKTVCNLPTGTCLVMQYSPAGAAMPNTQYWNGDAIFAS